MENNRSKQSKKLTFGDFKKQALKQKKFKEAYDQLQPEFDLQNQLIIAKRYANALGYELHIKLIPKQMDQSVKR